MRWAIFENTIYKTQSAYLYFEDAGDDYDVLRESALLFPDEDDESSFPCVVSEDGVCRHFTEGFEGFDGESRFLGFEDVVPCRAEDPRSSASDVAYPLPFEAIYPKNANGIAYGWLSPEGDTYSCLPDGHEQAANAIIEHLGLQGDLREYLSESERGLPQYDFLLDIGWAMLNPVDSIYEDVANHLDPSEVPALFVRGISEKQERKIKELGMWTYMVDKRFRWFEDSPPF